MFILLISFKEDNEFESVIRRDLLSEKVYPYSESGIRIEIPKGSTMLDYVAMAKQDGLDYYGSALVNEKEVGLDYVIGNNDRIVLIPGTTDDEINLDGIATTIKGEQLVKRRQYKKEK